MAYLLLGLAVTFVTVRVVHARARRVRGGRLGILAIFIAWPFVVATWVMAGVIAAGHVWLTKNGSTN